MVTYDQIKNDKDIKTYIMMADQTLSALGFTEHSLPHVTRAADVAGACCYFGNFKEIHE